MGSKIQNINHTNTANDSKLRLDFIGDVHGYANALENILRKMGYIQTNKGWAHPTNIAVFVGDFINRGPHNRKTIEIIRTMVENNHAYAILGNHEINAICYFTKRKSGKPLRMPGPANRKQLDKIKREYITQPTVFEDTIKWLRHLPLYINFGSVRVVHAYWNDAHISLLYKEVPAKKLTKSFLKEAMQGGTEISKAFIQTTRGVEFCFPPNLIVRDNSHFRRINFRVKWWNSPYDKTYEEISMETKYHLPNIPVHEEIIVPFEVYKPTDPPVFIGHYSMNGHNPIQSPNVCCVDAGVAAKGRLAAYRWSGEQVLDINKMIFADSFSDEDD